ncbi:putative elongation factor 1-gamma [Caenorhabditis elegans]|uniref:Isoform c of Probable elongation factor 1-gamma n=1 Tax=Caenorhabditis elegans TaxID=6239 RepID=P54412-3|nr:putative elongation factor 1-gamma [Caenorhabditis elegans]CAJ55245.1 Probable elongation factor 1-gamma [Caenorhabditis elegans]|eukprot:NP_001041100.1 Probable elongation factor 1-gamma [Caenorhabditis elegans]
MTGKLYGNKDNFRTQKVLIAAKLANKTVTLAGDAAPADKFPLGVTPAFEGDALLFGAESIGLHLTGTSANAETVQWLQFAEGYLLPAVLGYVLPSVSAANFDKKTVEQYKNELNGQLQYVLDANARKSIVNVTRWFRTVVNQPAVKEVLGEVSLASSVAQFNQAKFTELSAKVAKSAPKAEKPKKEAKPAAAAAQPEDDEPKEEKSKDPFQDMPKGTFVLDNFKRSYSNEDTATKAIPHFWENFDADNWSIWKCEYKYPEDLTLAFMSCNLINGMYQRLEKLKKNAFASMILFGTDNNSTISGIWVWKGDKLAFELSPDWQVDYESYTWTKLDAKSDATKKEVNEYLMWEGDFGGKKFNQGKIFK